MIKKINLFSIFLIFLFIGTNLNNFVLNNAIATDPEKSVKPRMFYIHQKGKVNWAFKGTEIDTSLAFDTNKIMTIFGVIYDGIDGDSSQVKLYLDAKGVDGWVSGIKTKTILDDSTEFTWELTATYVASSDSMRLRSEGLSDNRKDANVIMKLLFKGCN